jgi:hypothetical protein
MPLSPRKLTEAFALAAGAAAIAVVPRAAAGPVWPVAGAESAAATIADLQAQGYNVAINWVFGHGRTRPFARQ